MFGQFFLAFFLFFSFPILEETFSATLLSAASYDYYVKEGEDGDGSEDDPFGSIKDAIDAVGDSKGKRIYVSSGSYSASVTAPKGTTIVGSDAKEVSITGTLTLADDVELEKLGFTGAGNILVTKNAHVVLEKLRLKSLSGLGIGIKTEPGSTQVTVRDSVLDAAKKGMYIQAGSTLIAENVEVINSQEEGIDIRENVNGSITKSIFRDNKESGVEIILGSANFTISGNTFSGNGASGIATQYFQGAKKVGDVRIESNTFSKNDNYGVDCKAPQEGPDSKFYYLNSLNIQSNTFKENNEGDIAKRCKILTDEERIALEKEEAEKKALAEEAKVGLTLTEAALADRLAKSVELRRMSVAKYTEVEHARLEPNLQAIDTLEQAGSGKVAMLAKSRSSWKCYLRGTEGIDAELTRGGEEFKALVTRLEKEHLALRYESNQELAQAKLETLRSFEESFTKAKLAPACGFSLFGWVMNLWQKNETDPIFETAQSITFLDQNTEAKALFLGTLSYYPKVREVAVRSGDERLLSGLNSIGSQYASMLANLRFPLGTEADPLPATAAAAEISFPLRFANHFRALGIQSVHVSPAADTAALEKTGVNLSYADIEPLGQFVGGEKRVVSYIGPQKLSWIAYREGVNEDLTFIRETLKTLQTSNEPGVVVVSWDEKKGRAIIPERKALMRELVQAGAKLIISTGLMIPFEQEVIDTVPVYYSLGSAFEKFQTGDTSKKSIALEMSIDADGKLRVTEKGLVFTAEKGLEILP